MGPTDVLGIGRGDLTVPIVAEAQGLELAPKGLDVGGRGHSGVLSGFDGVLLRRKAEGIVTHRVQHIEAVHPLVSADDIRRRITFRMSHMKSRTTWVGKHVEHVILRLGGIESRFTRVGRAKGFLGIPAGLPLGFKLGEGKRFTGFGHGRQVGGKVG